MQTTSSNDDEYIHHPLLTVSDAARFPGVDKRIVYQLVESDQIRAVKDKGKILMEYKSLEAFRASGRLT